MLCSSSYIPFHSSTVKQSFVCVCEFESVCFVFFVIVVVVVVVVVVEFECLWC